MHDFSVCLRNGYNPAVINQLRSHTGKSFLHARMKRLQVENDGAFIQKQFSWSTAKPQHNFSKNILALADSCNPVEVYPYGLLYMWSLLTFTKPNLIYYEQQKYVFSLENIVSKYDIWEIAII